MKEEIKGIKDDDDNYLYLLMGQLYTSEPSAPDVLAVFTMKDRAEDFLTSVNRVIEDHPDSLGYDGDFAERSLSGYNSFHLWKIPNFECIVNTPSMDFPMLTILKANIENFKESDHQIEGRLPNFHEFKSIMELAKEEKGE